ncbi:metallophosphoesterase [Lutibacter sp.]
MKRRKFIKKSILSTLGITFVTGIYSWKIEPFWLEFVHKKMPIKNLPKHLQGKTLIQISDMHVGNRFDPNYITNSFKKAQKYNPDFVVYTGDYTTFESQEQYEQLREVLKNAVKGTFGTVAVLGNHDYGENWEDASVAATISKILNEANITVLRNEQKEINGLNFIGFDDYWGTNFFPENVMSKYNEHIANIALCHNPDACDEPVWNNYKGWILAGHTHGGQIKPPFLKSPFLPVKNKRYTTGEIDLYDGRTLYINRALGHIRQVRFNVRPEITIFKLETS